MLGTARSLFVFVGVFWSAIGVAGAALVGRRVGAAYVFVSVRADTALFGGLPEEALAADRNLATLKVMLVRALCGFMLAAGVLCAAVAWFGLAEPRIWALTTLTAVGLIVLPYWWFTLAPYRAAGYTLRLADIPPFMWVPAIVMPIASVLGWAARAGR